MKKIKYLIVLTILLCTLTSCKKTKYNVTFEYGNGEEAYIQSVEKKGFASEIVEPTKDGHTFLYWEYNGNQFDFNTKIEKDITLNAKWEANKLYISFSGIDESFDFIEVLYGNTTSLPTPSKEGHKFAGWYKDDTFEEKVTSNTQIKENLNLVAKWDKNVYKVKFDSNGGSDIDTQYVEYGNTIELIKPKRNDSKFVCWLLDGVEFDVDTPITDDIELVAKWEPHFKVTIHYNNNLEDEIIYVPKNYSISSAGGLDIPEYEGYQFVNYYYDEDLTQPVVLARKVTSDIEVYAKWYKLYYINYELNGGYSDELIESYTAESVANYPSELVNPRREGYFFRGWYETNLYTGDMYYQIEKGEARDITLYAKWEEATLENAYLSIIGDSISTYSSVKPDSSWLNFYPAGDVSTINSTWWKLTQTALGCRLGVVNSASGSCVMKAYDSSTMPASEKIERLRYCTGSNLLAPDIIIVFMGMNDSLANVHTNYGAIPADFKVAYQNMIKNLYTLYPDVQLFLCTLTYEYNYESGSKAPYLEQHKLNSIKLTQIIESIATEYNIPVIDFGSAYSTKDHLMDTVHPNAKGMRALADVATKTIKEFYNIAEPTEVAKHISNDSIYIYCSYKKEDEVEVI